MNAEETYINPYPAVKRMKLAAFRANGGLV